MLVPKESYAGRIITAVPRSGYRFWIVRDHRSGTRVASQSAGIRTYSIVGTSAALFVLISKYGFDDVLAPGRVVLDPSRVAAQIVTGIGFIGAGLIFVRQDRVTGLTTAATVWLVTAVGMACGAGLLKLALLVTCLYFVVAFVFPAVLGLFPNAPGTANQKDGPEHD